MGIITEMFKTEEGKKAKNILNKKLGDVIHHWEEGKFISKALQKKIEYMDKKRLGRLTEKDIIDYERFKLQNKEKLEKLGLIMEE